MLKVIWLLRLFAKAWALIAAALVSLGALSIFLQHGWNKLIEIFDPYNLWNTAAVLLVFSPSMLARWYSDHLQDRVPLTPEAADQIVRAYGAALERRNSLPAATWVDLPASKERIKEALRIASTFSTNDPTKLGVLGGAYVLLSDFQSSTSTMESRLTEMIALKSEWNRWEEKLAEGQASERKSKQEA